jgi:putative hydrolase of the HAD superfamily
MLKANDRKPAAPLPIRAVILDYGEVMCRRPNSEIMGRMATVLRLNPEVFFEHYVKTRGPYDQGMVTGLQYWAGFGKERGISLEGAQIERLRHWDTEMWSDINLQMTAWLRNLHLAGMLTALLSNMQMDMAAHARKTFGWLEYIDHQVFSCEVRAIKPDSAIYKHCLQKLGTQPEESLFIDDREPNVQAALALGIRAIRFRSVEQLRADLKAIAFAVLPSDSTGPPIQRS